MAQRVVLVAAADAGGLDDDVDLCDVIERLWLANSRMGSLL